MWTEIAKKLGVELDELFDIVNIEGQSIAKNIYIDQLWSIYPCKKGKKKAYAKIPNLIEKYSFDELSRCIERYKLSVEHERKNGFESLRYMQGDTFFNGRYMDYLDCNYKGIENKLDEETKGKVLDFVIGE